ncbi:MAG: DUF1207 domain-containing protein [Methylobacter sp.]|uniref:DUF1207 domain-containing protein n=1 Tax=Methylobacter sp. TaxID=2051955 RepID=UPI002730D9D7|nr:DUF1207 domain-containing protein [Methylobacter sp.]MDP1667274.1 DUF1207 domain-containing protein [Methylobacter sp.]
MAYLRLMTVLGVILPVSLAHAIPADDAYIAGYAAGVLKQSLKVDMRSLVVKDGVITLPTGSLNTGDRAKAVQLLSEIPGVNAVKVSEVTSQQLMTDTSRPGRVPPDETVSATESIILPTGLLPAGHLFKTLLADPRWAHFSAAYRNYQSNNFDGRDIASVSFGETIPIYRGNFGQSTAQWEAGLQAGVFSDFNLNASSSDLVNTDFIVSAYSSLRAGQFSTFGRLYHQSSHLGDEFLLRKINTKFERVNLSYEGVDLKLSYEFPYGIRLYGGGGGLFHREPSELKIWSAQYGLEFRSPWRMELASMRPVIAVDVKNHEENNWNYDVSARAGVEFENLQVLGRKLQILAEYYNGFSPSGQFYKEKVEYIGLGAHYLF